MSTTKKRGLNTKVLYIDDTGLSTLIGGAIIGCYDERRGRFGSVDIPLSIFRETDKKHDKLHKAISDATMLLVKGYRNHNQTIFLCHGSCFNRADRDLSEAGFHVLRGIIKEPLQSWLKERHFKSLVSLGMQFEQKNSHYVGVSIDAFADWVARDYWSRECYVKNKHKSWVYSWRSYTLALYCNKYRNGRVKQECQLA